jgi:hypothetical protein
MTPKIVLSAAFLFILPIVGGQLQGYSAAHTKTSGQTTVFKTSSWPPVQQAAVTQVQEQRG